jgi:hypothetical protein
MSIEDKLTELAKLATQLEEAKAKEATGSKEDEPEGTKEDQIEGDDVEASKSKMTESTVEPINLGPLFEGTELTDEFKLKATAVFEAAVDARVKQEVATLKESLEQTALAEMTALEESLTEKVDGYLDYMSEQWMEKNTLAVDRGIKVEVLESFVSGLKDLFESHYIDVPDEKYDLVEAAQAEATELAKKLDEAVEENIALRSSLKETARLIQIEEAVDGLAETDAEKFRELAESLSFTNEEEYATKLKTLRENYFTKSTAKETAPLQEEFMTDTPVDAITEETIVDPAMRHYMSYISKK